MSLFTFIRSNRRQLICASVLACVSFCLSAQQSSTFFALESFEKAVSHVSDKGFSGVITVADKNGHIFTRSIGYAIEDKKPYSTSTVVDIASITKQFTAAAIMKLRENGKIKLSARLSDYLPNIPADKANITIHQLLTHTAGFKRHLGRDENTLTKAEFLNQVFALPLTFAIGEKYHYSDIGYNLLAYLVELLSKRTFENFLFDELFQPAGMFSTGYERPNWADRTIVQIREPYAGFTSPLELVNSTRGQNWNFIGAGGILSTSQDMLLWHKALLSNKILSEKSKQLMFTAHVPEHDEGYFYGYGWSVVPFEQQEELVWHNGLSFFGKAEYWRLPKSGLMIFVASHQSDIEPWHIANALFQALRTQ